MGLDSEVFWRVESLYRALSRSSKDVVLVPDEDEEIPGPDFLFDCRKDGRLIVEERLRTQGQTVKEAYHQHKIMLNHFYDIQEIANRGNRSHVARGIEDMVGDFKNYLDLVKSHREEQQDNYFLFYPTDESFFFGCLPHEGGKMNFNKEANYSGAVRDLDRLKDSLVLFTEVKTKLRYPVEPIPRDDQGTGIDDRSYRAAIEKVKQALKENFNFDVEN